MGTAMEYDFGVMVELYLQPLLIPNTKRKRRLIVKAWQAAAVRYQIG